MLTSGTISFTPVECDGRRRVIRVSVCDENSRLFAHAALRAASILSGTVPGIDEFEATGAGSGGTDYFLLKLREDLRDEEIRDALRVFRYHFLRDLRALTARRAAEWFTEPLLAD